MNRRKLSVYHILWATIVFGSLSAAQDGDGAKPNYHISYPNHRYNFKATSLADVNFKDMTVFWLRDDKTVRDARLLNGTFEQKYGDGGGEKVSVDLVRTFDLPGELGSAAVIDISWTSCGGSCFNQGLVQVFELRSKHPTIVEQIIYDRHAPDTGVKFDVVSGVLSIAGRSAEASPNCCAKSLDVMTFEWESRNFVFKGNKRVTVADTP